MAIRWARDRRPVHGPYAEAWFDEADQVYRVRLTAEGKEKAAEYLSHYPHPMGLLIAVWPAAYRSARAARLSDEEIDALCLESVALAFARHDPSRGAGVGTAVAWALLAGVGNAVRRVRRTRAVRVLDLERYSGRVEHSRFALTNPLSAPQASDSSDEASEELARRLAQANLSKREFQVLTHRFGLGGRRAMTTPALGRAMRLTAERVRQIQEVAIRKVREAAAAS